ncbi:AbrB/MazE/SpoVT family DNA-binding domain-containing protein [Methanobrevibacter sp. OttesenSCG-928-I08]|nr:AbrB/MazE/SpoVT family DNA-binding domain-containing protein [Methanobrevibacter sp. OttesenSCG-928-I08]
MFDSKINKGYKVTIPIELVEELGIKENDKISLKINEQGNMEIIPRKKTLNDIKGMISDENMDSLKDTAKAGRGEKI